MLLLLLVLLLLVLLLLVLLLLVLLLLLMLVLLLLVLLLYPVDVADSEGARHEPTPARQRDARAEAWIGLGLARGTWLGAPSLPRSMSTSPSWPK